MVALQVENEAPAVPVLINPKRLRRVFRNLAQNAVEAMTEGEPAREPKIILRFRATPAEVVTEMEDTGPGVAPEIADHLFRAFTTHGKQHGTGLGLSICKRILADHHGWIQLCGKETAGGGRVLPMPKA